MRRILSLCCFIVLYTMLLTASCASLSLQQEQGPAVSGPMTFSCSSPRFYFTGEQWTDAALELIEGARSSILIDTFLIGEHHQSMLIFSALSEAAGRGVEVRIIIDSSSFYRIDRTTGKAVRVCLEQLRKLGIAAVEYNPIRVMNLFRLTGLLDRDHRKYWVIDGRTVVVGGMNIDADSLMPHRDSGNLDGMCLIESPEAAEALSRDFIRSWDSCSLEKMDPPVVTDSSTSSFRADTSVRVYHQDRVKRQLVTEMFDSIFEEARHSIVMIQCYLILSPALLQRMEDAVDRGVDVHIILSSDHVSPRFEKASYHGIADLLEAGARVSIYDSPHASLLHTKLITADESVVSIGSANYNYRSEHLSREISLVFDDSRVYQQVRPFIEQVLLDTREVDEQEAARYRDIDHWLTHLMMQLGG